MSDTPSLPSETLLMKDLSWDDRPYEKLENKGAAHLSDAELVAILLKSGVAGRNSLDLARTVLAGTGGLANVASVSLEELQRYAGVGRVKSIVLKAAVELGRRIERKQPPRRGEPIRSPDDAHRVLAERMGDLEREEFHVLLLDARHRLIRGEQVSAGGLAAAVVFPRDVFRLALKANAAALMLAHNHPSGDAEPSKADLEATRVFENIGRMMGIPVLDHLIIVRDGFVSLKQKGHL